MKVRDDLWARRPAPRRPTPGQRWRARRDLVIYLAATHGATYRLLADVFDLPHSRIHEIVKAMRAKADGGPSRTG